MPKMKWIQDLYRNPLISGYVLFHPQDSFALAVTFIKASLEYTAATFFHKSS